MYIYMCVCVCVCVTHHVKSRLLSPKSKFVLFSHEILCCKTFQMTYYSFIYDIPNRSCVILKYSSVENYFWRKMQSKFGKYASLAEHCLIVKLSECRLFFLPIIFFAPL